MNVSKGDLAIILNGKLNNGAVVEVMDFLGGILNLWRVKAQRPLPAISMSLESVRSQIGLCPDKFLKKISDNKDLKDENLSIEKSDNDLLINKTTID